MFSAAYCVRISKAQFAKHYRLVYLQNDPMNATTLQLWDEVICLIYCTYICQIYVQIIRNLFQEKRRINPSICNPSFPVIVIYFYIYYKIRKYLLYLN
jgi:hypothetical protein